LDFKKDRQSRSAPSYYFLYYFLDAPFLTAELKTADPAMAAQVLGAWKELIMGEMVKLLQATNDPKILQLADENIALAQGTTRLKFGVVAGGKK
jgi:hypothetical protein